MEKIPYLDSIIKYKEGRNNMTSPRHGRRSMLIAGDKYRSVVKELYRFTVGLGSLEGP